MPLKDRLDALVNAAWSAPLSNGLSAGEVFRYAASVKIPAQFRLLLDVEHRQNILEAIRRLLLLERQWEPRIPGAS